MRCPTDGAELVMAERQGVEIDYCPSCRGIWLDRGELDKILDRAAGVPAGAPPAPAVPLPPEPGYGGYPPAPAAPGHGDDRRYDDRGDRRYGDRYGDDRRGARDDDRRDPRYPYGRKKRRESWLGDLLDFD